MTTYEVLARRWARGWELHIADLGVTQSPNLTGAEKMVREYIALALDLDDETGFEVHITPEVNPQITQHLNAARKATMEAERAQRQAAVQMRQVAREMVGVGLSGNDIAKVLNVSKQRVSQLIK